MKFTILLQCEGDSSTPLTISQIERTGPLNTATLRLTLAESKCLLMSALPTATHILDWFHLTRRLTVLKGVLFGKEAINQFPTDYHDPLCKHLESLKWRLWHGYVGGAFNLIRTP